MPNSKVDAKSLTGVSETTLWTLYCRAYEASRTDPLIDDPLAVQLVDDIDYDFWKFERVGIPKSNPESAQAHHPALRRPRAQLRPSHPRLPIQTSTWHRSRARRRTSNDLLAHRQPHSPVDLTGPTRRHLHTRKTVTTQSSNHLPNDICVGFLMAPPSRSTKPDTHHCRRSADVPAARPGANAHQQLRATSPTRSNGLRRHPAGRQKRKRLAADTALPHAPSDIRAH